MMEESGLRHMRRAVRFGSSCIDSIQRRLGGGKKVSAFGWRTNLNGRKIIRELVALILMNFSLMLCRTCRVSAIPSQFWPQFGSIIYITYFDRQGDGYIVPSRRCSLSFESSSMPSLFNSSHAVASLAANERGGPTILIFLNWPDVIAKYKGGLTHTHTSTE